MYKPIRASLNVIVTRHCLIWLAILLISVVLSVSEVNSLPGSHVFVPLASVRKDAQRLCSTRNDIYFIHCKKITVNVLINPGLVGNAYTFTAVYFDVLIETVHAIQILNYWWSAERPFFIYSQSALCFRRAMLNDYCYTSLLYFFICALFYLLLLFRLFFYNHCTQ